jgi:hypothetical protein
MCDSGEFYIAEAGATQIFEIFPSRRISRLVLRRANGGVSIARGKDREALQ